MIKTFTFVRRRPHLDRDAFFERWVRHTRDWDLRDHPDCTLNRLTLLGDNDASYDALAETHWPDQAALDAAIAFYGTPDGQAHWRDLADFMDIDASPTATIVREAEVAAEPAGDRMT